MRARVSIIMGSESDLPVMKSAAEVLTRYGVEHEVTIVSAHRTPERMVQFASAASRRGVKVIIAGAGGSAHLPGMVASLTSLPVIGVPIKTSKLDGVDSLLSIVQMPDGIPVATVAINGAVNAALLAVKMLAISDGKLEKKVMRARKALRADVVQKARRLEQEGFKKYISRMRTK